MSVRNIFLTLVFVFAVPAFVSAMTNDGAITDTSTTTTSSGTYNDDGSVGGK